MTVEEKAKYVLAEFIGFQLDSAELAYSTFAEGAGMRKLKEKLIAENINYSVQSVSGEFNAAVWTCYKTSGNRAFSVSSLGQKSEHDALILAAYNYLTHEE